MRAEQEVTILDVAARAGVHPSTVSRALTRPERVAAATRERVEEAVRELAFVPNRAAQRLITGRTGNVAVIVPDITNPYFASLVRAVEHAARARELQVLFVDTGEEADEEVKAARHLSRDVDGFIVLSPRQVHRELPAFGSKPTVFVNRPVKGRSSVLLRSAAAMNEALRHLAGLGHRTVAYLPGPRGSWAASERRSAVRATGKATGMTVLEFPVETPTFEAATEVVDDVLSSPATAVLTFNDQMALGAASRIIRRGVSIPDEMSIIGCDDVPTAWMAAPALTTIAMPITEAAASAVALLDDGGTMVEFHGSFVVRGSTGPVRSR